MHRLFLLLIDVSVELSDIIELLTVNYSLFLDVKLSSFIYKHFLADFNVSLVWFGVERPAARWTLLHVLSTVRKLVKLIYVLTAKVAMVT